MRFLLLSACLGGGFAPCLLAGGEPSSFQTNADSGCRIRDTGSPTPASSIQHPASGSHRLFTETDLLTLLTATLQQDYVKDKGELDLRLTRSWQSRSVPDEALSLKVLDLPSAGVTPSCIIRFELRTVAPNVSSGIGQSLGAFQTAVQAKVWREVWVAKSALKRGELVTDAAIARERRDVLTLREALADFSAGDATLELAEPLQAGAPLLARSVKVRPVIHRGQFAEARLQDGALQITLKVEALEDGAPGQTIRARNPITRRDLTGKVLDEQTLLIPL